MYLRPLLTKGVEFLPLLFQVLLALLPSRTADIGIMELMGKLAFLGQSPIYGNFTYGTDLTFRLDL
jgi:hypothetical protein